MKITICYFSLNPITLILDTLISWSQRNVEIHDIHHGFVATGCLRAERGKGLI